MEQPKNATEVQPRRDKRKTRPPQKNVQPPRVPSAPIIMTLSEFIEREEREEEAARALMAAQSSSSMAKQEAGSSMAEPQPGPSTSRGRKSSETPAAKGRQRARAAATARRSPRARTQRGPGRRGAANANQPARPLDEFEELGFPRLDPEIEGDCSCGKVFRGTMVGCDNRDCPHHWYHLDCVGIIGKPPLGAWFCFLCRLYQNRHDIPKPGVIPIPPEPRKRYKRRY